MNTETTLRKRSGSKCELCAADDNLAVYEIPPKSDGSPDECVLICSNCRGQIDKPEHMDANHWRCLNESM